MTVAYTPGLKVSPRTRHRARRLLPVAGEVLVAKGDYVEANDVVARAILPGDVTVVNLANALSVTASDIPRSMRVREGQMISEGDLVARSPGIFGFFPSEYHSRMEGTVETISNVTGQMIVRGPSKHVNVLAYLQGEVIDVIPAEGVVIETDAAVIQGIFGVGGEAHGEIVMACAAPDLELTVERIASDVRGKIVVGGARMTGDAIRKAAELGAAAVVSGGIDDSDLREILGYDLGVAVTGSETIGTTVIVTEGFGEIAMALRTFQLLSQHAGQFAAVNGTTQIRAGVLRPEIVIPLDSSQDNQVRRPADTGEDGMGSNLEIGSTVRMIRDPYFGLIGKVTELPNEPATLESGSKARVLIVTLDSGKSITVPRANVERIER